jgi:hypothetical protein
MMPEDYKKSLLKNIPDQKEKDMEIPRKESMPPATPEERISALEKKVRDQDALIKGLTEELLDLKSIAMRLNKVNEQQRTELKMTRPSAGAGSGTVVIPARAAPRVQPPPPPEPEKMGMIMQPDGTLKLEKRKSDDYIVASAAYSKKGKQQSSGSGKKNDLIVAEDEEKEAQKK